MSALICDRCGKEIVPGTTVEFVGENGPNADTPQPRIVTTDEVLVVHQECPA